MKKKAKDKKRRAGRYGKTKLKNKNFRRWNPNPKISDPIVKKNWDPSKSPAANLAIMGLQSEPGKMHQTQSAAEQIASKGVTNAIELFDIPDSDQLNEPKKHPMPTGDQQYIAKCFAKHGDNYKRMFMDIKTNEMQYTETQLRKMGSRFILLDAEQREVNIPENVQHLVYANQ
eukprot:CAMPEP_0194228778 /NCGR_PEP_ID=MMETSP0156-20130528/43546_1 /TAXON_ID=33649 /ORGANISM="Thalassionema nitzschioides, Strain L26-B" /LENGTH=172 /DNA_ID=CAMNT_0038961299 /DNA_START=57 /DNA_END=575 /DNA_ORIENTATION=+